MQVSNANNKSTIHILSHSTDAPAPRNVAVTPAKQARVLGVTWTAPTVDSGLTITGYSVQYKRSSDQSYTPHSVSGSPTSTSITGLQLGTTYSVRVAAIAQLGTGVYSNPVNVRTYNGEYT